MTGVSERLGDEERRGTVEPRRDLIHEEARQPADHHLSGGHALLLASRDALEQVVSTDRVDADVEAKEADPVVMSLSFCHSHQTERLDGCIAWARHASPWISSQNNSIMNSKTHQRRII